MICRIYLPTNLTIFLVIVEVFSNIIMRIEGQSAIDQGGLDMDINKWEYKGGRRKNRIGGAMLPGDAYVSKDPSLPGMPKFIKEPPAEIFVTSRAPALLEYVAQPASYISMECATSDFYSGRGRGGGSGPGGSGQGQRRMQPIYSNVGNRRTAQMNVTEVDVEEWFGDLWCRCEAWNNVKKLDKPQAVFTKKTIIKNAYLERRFKQEPISKSVELGGQLQFICQAPAGKPTPNIHWLKNGARVKTLKDPNYIIVSEGYLVVSVARLSDQANYTCVAESIAGTRRAEPVDLNVFVNGGWSSWSSGNACPSTCMEGRICDPECHSYIRRRSRVCNNPRPINDGALCKGKPSEDTPCSQFCAINGGWSSWEAWSACGPACQQIRNRSCTKPAPTRGGHQCSGVAIHTKNCSSNACQESTTKYLSMSEDARDIFMYTGLCIALLLLFVTIFIIIYMFRRKFLHSERIIQCRNGTGANTALHDGGTDKEMLKVREVLLPPDITQTSRGVVMAGNKQPLIASIPAYPLAPTTTGIAVGVSASYATIHDSPASSLSKAGTAGSGEGGEGGGGSATGNSVGELAVAVTGQSTRKAAPYHTVTLMPDHPGQMGPAAWGSDTRSAWGVLNHSGGRLVLPECGVSLTIAPASVPPGFSKEIFLAVSGNDRDRPHLDDDETLISSLVVCGPSDISLLKPVILSFPHCAALKRNTWAISVYTSDKTGNTPASWQEHVILGEETINTPSYCQLDTDVCHLMTEQLRAFCLVGGSSLCPPSPGASSSLVDHHLRDSPAGGSSGSDLLRASKFLRLAAFAHTNHAASMTTTVPTSTAPSNDFNIRVCILGDTKDAFERVVTIETRNGGRMLDTSKQLCFDDIGENLCFCVEDVSQGWQTRLNSKYQEIPFTHIWKNCQSNLYCTFDLDHEDQSQSSISCRIVIYQNNRFNNRQVIEITSNVNQNSEPEFLDPIARIPPLPSNSLIPAKVVFRLSISSRKHIATLLDPPNGAGNDWRMLARQLGVDRYINYFATKTSPTETILELWEARHREETAIIDLKKTLRAIGRLDVVSIMDFSSPWS